MLNNDITENSRHFSSFAENDSKHWAEGVADKILQEKPNENIYTFSSGISPSGVVHFGNFRDVMTSFAVAKALKSRGKNVRLLFFWDDYDRFRKVPAGVSADFEQYIGMPLSQVPDPLSEYPSYAKRFEVEFEKSVLELEMDLEFFYQNEEYKKGVYDEMIIHSLKNRKKIAEILLSSMSDKGKAGKNINEADYIDNYYPITVYSRFSGKDNTEVLSYDGDCLITYKCFDSGETETIDLKKEHIVKLSWKIDWPMRWKKYNVIFEPGGIDHATPGGSYDVSSIISKEVFDNAPPFFIGYQFIGIRGLEGKMSGSKGNAVSPSQLLEIYEPYLLKWLYLRRSPEQSFSLAFDTEIYRQYDEIDRETKEYYGNILPASRKTALELSTVDTTHQFPENPSSFRQIVGLGQIVQWNFAKLVDLMRNTGADYEEDVLKTRMEKARSWLETYNPDQIISLREEKNADYVDQMPDEKRERVRALKKELSMVEHSVEELNVLVYNIPKREDFDQKQNAILQRDFFKDVYNLLVGKDTGPRLSTFLWAADRKKILNLLDI